VLLFLSDRNSSGLKVIGADFHFGWIFLNLPDGDDGKIANTSEASFFKTSGSLSLQWDELKQRLNQSLDCEMAQAS
jgi:hypothetical protein